MLVTIPGNRLISGYRYPEIATEKHLFREYTASVKTKYLQILVYYKILGGLLIERYRYYWFMRKKTRARKSHATVPLKVLSHETKQESKLVSFDNYFCKLLIWGSYTDFFSVAILFLFSINCTDLRLLIFMNCIVGEQSKDPVWLISILIRFM